MVLKWKEKTVVEKYDNFGLPNKISDTDITYADMKKDSPRNYVWKKERYCPHCQNAESNVRSIKYLKKEMRKPYVQLVFNTISEKNMIDFDMNILKKEMGIVHLSDGSKQRKALGVLSCLGFIKIKVIKYKNKKNEIKAKYIYAKSEGKPKCYNETTDKHELDWVNEANEERYFQNE